MSPYRKLAEMFNLKSPAPKAPRDKTVDVYHGVKVPDPYRPLEKLDDKATVNWTEGQTNRFQDFISDVGGQAKMKKFLAEIWDYERESLPDRHGKRYFSSFMDGKAAQPVYRVRDSVDGTPRTLIDPNTLSKDGTVALSGVYPSPDGTKLAYLLSESGSDAQNLYVMDVATGKTTKDTITGCRFTGVTWDRDSKGFQYNYPAEDDLRRFKVMHHKLGDSPAQDRVVFERPGVEDSIVGAGRLNNEKQEPSGYEYAACRIGTNSAGAVYLKAPGEKTFSPLFEDGKSELNPIAMIEGKLYATTTLDAPKGRLVAIDPADPAPENWQTIVAEPDNSDILQWAFAHQGQLLVGYQHDTADRIALHKLDGTYKEDMPLPPQSVVGFAKVNKDDTEYLMNISGYQSPGASYKYDIATNSLKLWKTSAAKVDLEDAVIERVHATSKDGTKVPMTVIRNKDVKLDGSAATKLYGYGGFNVPLDPGFSFGTYNWVKEGGIYAVANLRGGGEFGSEWYDGGRLLKKQNVFDDFAACAEYLIDQKYTKPARLTINGGSNGGLLTLATMLQRPELFGAVVSHVPVTDMYRFHKFTYGAFWKSDYGDIEKSKADFNAAAGYSPLHNVKKDVNYPPTLVMTGDHDDRVVPSHAYKFVARMQEMARKTALCLLRVEKDAGHGAGKSKDKTITEMAEEHAFLVKTLGPIDQNQYKAMLKADQKKVAGNDNRADSPARKRGFRK